MAGPPVSWVDKVLAICYPPAQDGLGYSQFKPGNMQRKTCAIHFPCRVASGVCQSMVGGRNSLCKACADKCMDCNKMMWYDPEGLGRALHSSRAALDEAQTGQPTQWRARRERVLNISR